VTSKLHVLNDDMAQRTETRPSASQHVLASLSAVEATPNRDVC
jgi:hypothetical protein